MKKLTTILWAGIVTMVLSSAASADDLPFHAGSTTVVVLPDTQYYAQKHPHIFMRQLEWIAQNREARNIQCVLHVGDITQHNAPKEWEVARKAYDQIEGKIQYVPTLGNHDYSGGRDSPLVNQYFPAAQLAKHPNFGACREHGRVDNHYQFLTLNGKRWIIVSLECGPRKEVLEWADQVLEEHKENPAIIMTHGYLFYGNQRFDHTKGRQRANVYGFAGEGADGQMMWDQLIRKHRNTQIVICGHLASGYVGYRADEADYGNTVHQMMCVYQKMSQGGQGYLRLLEFLPDGKTVQVRTYSPVTGGTNPRDPKLEEFTFELQPATRTEPMPVPDIPMADLQHPPIHRYSFDKDAAPTIFRDSIGKKNGKLGPNAELNGKGQLVLANNQTVAHLPGNLLEGKTDFSFEIWFTATSDHYSWNPVVRFGSKDDWLTYTFRTLDCHRAEIAVDGHNEDIQRKGIPVAVGKAMHVVVTYDADGDNGQPLLSYYRDGEMAGKMGVSLQLTDVEEAGNLIGPFAGEFDELRLYDYPLTPEEVSGNHWHGPNKLIVDKKKTRRSQVDAGM